MAKEKTTLINMRIPNGVLERFDKEVTLDDLAPSRTALITQLMAEHIGKKMKERRLNKDKK